MGALSRAGEGVRVMVKDIVVNLTGGHPQDFAADYAISLAATFGAHIAGVGFIYEPVIPGTILGDVPTDLIEVQREENSKAAKSAIGRFEATAKAAGISAETRMLDSIVAGTGERDKSGEITGTNMRRHLARHGIEVEIKRISAGGGVDVPNAILSHAADIGAKFMVLGGYGHSRLREFILGGVTRSILS